MSFLVSIWSGIKAVILGIGKFVSYLQPFNLPAPVRYVLGLLFLAGFLVLLYFLNRWFGFRESVNRFWAGPYWLPILGLLIVLIGVVLYWLYLLGQTDDTSPFPDILDAWLEAKTALDKEGISLADTPLFLVLGRPGTSEKNLFEAAGMELLVKQAPANPRSPLLVFGSHNAVYITCRGASLLGRLAGIFALEEMQDLPSSEEEEDFMTKTLGRDQNIQDVVKRVHDQEANSLTRRFVRRKFGKAFGPDFLADTAEVARLKARLTYLCRLIIRDRQPYCPANGILLLIPLGATDTAQDAQQTAQACQEDLSVVRQEMKLDCPILSLLVDLEDLPGFAEFIKRTAPKERERRLGVRFPMATKLQPDQIRDHIENSLHWVCTTYLQDNVFPKFQTESPQQQESSPLFPDNARLFQILEEMSRRAEPLAAIINQAVVPHDDMVLRYAGCYLAATGPKECQGFVGGVVQRLTEEQSSVTWTEEALAEDADNRTWGFYYSILSGVLALALGAIIYWLVYRRYY